MGLIFFTMMGAILGWVASMLRKVGNNSALRRNVVAGTLGSLIGGIASNPLSGQENSLLGATSVEALLISLIGALALLTSVNLLHRSEMR